MKYDNKIKINIKVAIKTIIVRINETDLIITILNNIIYSTTVITSIQNLKNTKAIISNKNKEPLCQSKKEKVFG